MAAPEGYTKLGNVGYADKGVYSADATYNKYNTVYHEGSTYVALKDNLHGVTPADGANWRYMAKGFTEASADAITVIDTSGIIDGTKNKKTILQTFLDKVGDFIINKAVTNDALMLKLADYVAKTDIVQVESTATNKVPSSAYLKQVKDSIDSNFTTDYLALNTLFSQPISETDVCYVMRYGHIVFLKLTVKFAQALAGTTTWLILPEQFRPKYYVKAPATLFKNGLPTGDTVSILVNGEIKTDSGADSGAWNFVYTSYYVE